MATRINNIEKFVRDLFQNFRVKPSTDSWNKIADALDNTNPKDAIIPEIDEIGTLFQGYKVTPSERVWQNIYRILERDKFTLRRLSKSTVAAIVAFFSNTTAKVITSVVIVGGLSLLIFNPFKDHSTKIAAIESPKQVNLVGQKAKPFVNNPQQSLSGQTIRTGTINNPQSAIRNQQSAYHNQQSATNNTADYSQMTKSDIKSKPIAQKQIALNNKTHTVPTTPIKQQTGDNTNIESQNPVISKEVTTSNYSGTNTIIVDTKSNTLINENLLSRYPSIKMGINQNRLRFDKATPYSVDLQKKMDGLVDRFYRQWAKKFKRNKDLFYIEAYYMPIYGWTTFIAEQENSATLSRSYNEYLTGTPSSCLGINFGYNPNKFAYETGIMYEDMHTRRNDDLTWISYEITKDSIGFIFNTVDSTYHTIYSIDTVKNELLKQYRSRMTYHTVEVPFLIGYKLIDKRYTIMIRTGILASFIIGSADEISNIDETARPYITYPERNKVDFSYVLNLSYDYNITDNFRFSATPTLRCNLTGLYKGYSIIKSPVSVGFGIGVKYIF